MSMVELFINNNKFQVEKGSTILQACASVGLEIPRFCYHEKLSIAGNCRMCLVEVEKAPKPVASCAVPVMDGMRVHTNTTVVKKAREGILEFLLANHPLDCPICDQGGECDLQDQAVVFGNDRGRFYEHKRAVQDKDCGPLIKTLMTRCIHCTRCIRFASEIAGLPVLGTTGRGSATEVGTYVKKMVDSEVSGNIIDLCPVGALTSKPYAFTARSWELRSIETVDVLDSLCSNIRIDIRGTDIMRILPRVNEDINEEWINDKTRFAYDGLKRQRLTTPMIRQNDKLVVVSWEDAFGFIKKNKEKLKNIKGIVGKFVESEALIVFKNLLNKLGSVNFQIGEKDLNFQKDLRSHYLFNTKLTDIEKSDFCLLIGVNPKIESPLLNVRLRKQFLSKENFLVYSFGPSANLTYYSQHLGNDIQTLVKFVEGTHPICRQFIRAKTPLIIVGSAVFERSDANSFYNLINTLTKNTNLINDNWNGLNFLHLYTGYLNAAEILNQKEKIITKYDSYYLLGVEDFDLKDKADSFIIYQGHHGDSLANYADVILPGVSYVEKNALYINIEGRVQQGKFAVKAPGDARIDWHILRALGEYLNINLGFNKLKDVRKSLSLLSPHYAQSDYSKPYLLPEVFEQKNTMYLQNIPFNSTINNFYMTDSISKSSYIMALCTNRFLIKTTNFLKE